MELQTIKIEPVRPELVKEITDEERAYFEKFVEYTKDKNNLRGLKYKLNMEELQKANLQMIKLDYTTDSALPRWAMSIIRQRGISQRTKLLLLQYHNLKITKHRNKLAMPTVDRPIQNETEEGDEY